MAHLTSGLSDEERELVVAFAAGSVVCREGDHGREMFLIVSGEVEVLRQGRRLGVLGGGDFFGEMALLEGLPRSAEVKAVSECLLLPIDSAAFDHMIRSVPELAVRIMRKLSGRLRGRLASPPLEASAAAPAPRRASPAKLVHPGSGREFPLPGEGELSIGRPDSVTGIVPDIDLSVFPEGLSVSRKHARLVAGAEGFQLLEEIGVANGTTVNGVVLHPGRAVTLHDGDQIGVGQTVLRFAAGAS